MSLSVNAAPQQSKNGIFMPGQSGAIQEVNGLVDKIADTNVAVLLLGESGTGKEVYARMIHRLSKYGHFPLKRVSCRGAEQGEFIALKSDLKGGSKNSGDVARTLFLDGIDELGLESQKLLLSFLPEGESDESESTGTRVIASASRNLEKEIESGKFRRELYFRINGVCLHLPPLRDRREDVHLFVGHFLAKHAAELGREAPVLSGTDMEFLVRHEWPGNVRELENLARRIVLLGDAGKAILELGETSRLDPTQQEKPSFSSLKAAARNASRRAERDLIAKALEATHWNRKRAAQQLQISYKSLLYKIKQTGLEE